MKITFFPGSVVGYIDHPQAILTRGLAYGLAQRGNDVRIVEERQNEILKRTLLAIGAGPSRHFHEQFLPNLQYHTYEPRTGAPLLEWVTRELALIDVGVAVDGVEQELCRWLGNVNREGLIRAYLTFDPGALTDERARQLDIDKYDIVIAPSKPAADLPWSELTPVVATPDDVPDITQHLPASIRDAATDAGDAAIAFEKIVTVLRR